MTWYKLPESNDSVFKLIETHPDSELVCLADHVCHHNKKGRNNKLLYSQRLDLDRWQFYVIVNGVEKTSIYNGNLNIDCNIFLQECIESLQKNNIKIFRVPPNKSGFAIYYEAEGCSVLLNRCGNFAFCWEKWNSKVSFFINYSTEPVFMEFDL